MEPFNSSNEPLHNEQVVQPSDAFQPESPSVSKPIQEPAAAASWSSEPVQQSASVAEQPSEMPEVVPANMAEASTPTVAAINPPVSGTPPAMPTPAGDPQIVTSGGDMPPAATPLPAQPAPSGKSGKRWVLPAALLIVLLLVLGSGYAFAVYLPNQPSNVYSSSLKNSGKAVDVLVNYSNSQSQKNYKSYNVAATVHTKSSAASFDTTLSGSFDKTGSGTLAVNADILGQKFSANVRSIVAAGATTPDVFLQLTGIKSALDSYGLSSLDSVDGKWLSIDHTLIDTYSANLKQALPVATGIAASNSTVPTRDQLHDAITKVQTANKKYIFTADTATAVLKQQKYIGKETKDGRSTYRYKVGYNKGNLESYVDALKSELDTSSLNTWSKAAYGKNLSEVLDLSSLKTSVQKSSGNYSFDVWADTKTKLIHTVQFTDPSDTNTVVALTQNYTGGTQYPFMFNISGKDSSSGDKQNAALKFNVDTKTNKDSGSFTYDQAGVALTADFSLTPSNTAVQVTAPAGAQSVTSIISQLGLGGL